MAEAQDIGAQIYLLCDSNFKVVKDFSFKDQVKRAALSISNNIAEGVEYNNNNDFYQYLRIAKGSCGEVRNCVLFSVRINYTNLQEVGPIIEYSRTLGRQIGSLMKYLKDYKIKNRS